VPIAPLAPATKTRISSSFIGPRDIRVPGVILSAGRAGPRSHFLNALRHNYDERNSVDVTGRAVLGSDAAVCPDFDMLASGSETKKIGLDPNGRNKA